MEVISNLSRCCHLTSPTCLMPAYSSCTSSRAPSTYTHFIIIIIIIIIITITIISQCFHSLTYEQAHTDSQDSTVQSSSDYLHTDTHTGHFTYRLSISPFHTHTHTHYLLPSPHLISYKYFFRSLQLISLASLALPTPRRRPSPLCSAVSSCTITNAHNPFPLIPSQSS